MVDNDLDIWMKAMTKIDLTEAVSPIIKGHLLLEETQVEFYNKIQKLLNSRGMEDSHAWLYNLDPTDLTECECSKIDKLYSLAQDRGIIAKDPVEEPEDTVEEPTQTVIPVQPIKQTPKSAFTILYSATRDGDIKTGEAYSNSINTRSAKADVISKLEKAGYQNISILAIEANDPDMCGCDNTFCKQPDYETPNCEGNEATVDEADDREPLGHALDPYGIKASTANLKRNNSVTAEMTIAEEDEEEKEDSDNDDEKSDDSAEKDEEKEDSEEDKKDATEDADKSEDKEEDKKEEKSEEPDEKMKDDDAAEDAEKEDSEEGKELSDAEKESLRDSYKKAFKAALEKGKYNTSFSELNLEQKIKFFTELQKAWGNKADPSKFMDDKSQEQLEKIVVKK